MCPDNIPLRQWSGSDAVDELRETVKAYQQATAKQTRQMIRLTRMIAVLTVAMLVGLVLQLWLAVVQ